MSKQINIYDYFKDSDMPFVQSLTTQNGIPEEQILRLPLKSPKTAQMLSFFLGFFGVDRFYSGNYVQAILKFTLFYSGIGLIWWIIDWFFIANSVKSKNLEVVVSALDANVSQLTTTDKILNIAKNKDFQSAAKGVLESLKNVSDSMDIN